VEEFAAGKKGKKDIHKIRFLGDEVAQEKKKE